MNEENKEVQKDEGQEKKGQCQPLRVVLMMCLTAMMLVPSAFASGETPTGLNAVLAQSSNATSLIGSVFDLITSNPYLSLLMLFGLMAAALRLFRRGKRAAR